MATWFVTTLRQNAELAIFLALAIGYWIGPLKIAGFTFGNVTACLLAGVIVGQLDIPVPGPLKAFVFLLFLFAVGYRVGPQFFAGLKRDGLGQVVFAVVAAVLMLAATVGFATAVHFNAGQAAGLLAGSLTQSAAIGTATDALSRLNLSSTVMKTLQDQIAVGYAVAYVMSTFTGVFLCTKLVPMLFRFDLAQECRKLEVQLGIKPELPPGVFGAYANNAVRAVRISENGVAGKTVSAIEREFEARGHRVFLAAIRRGGNISTVAPGDVITGGDVVALAGPTEVVIAESAGREVHDPELLDLPFAQLDVVVTNPAIVGKTVEQVMASGTRAVVLKKIVREGVEAPVLPLAVIDRGDTLTISGFASSVEAAAQTVGYAVRPSPAAEVIFISLGILIGGLIGTLSVTIGAVPIGLGTSCGALVAGLVAGYLRGRLPTFGNISPGAQWVFDSFALCVFVTVVGIGAGPGFVAGLKSSGAPFVLGGVAIPLVSLLVAAVFGKYVLKFNNVILCGALAGADTSSASFGAMQDIAKSNLFTLGYTITYAVGNVLLTIWGTVIVALFAGKTAV